MGGLLDQDAQIDRLELQVQRPALEACGEEEIGDEAEQACRVPLDDLEVPQPPGVVVLLEQQLDVAADRGERRSQLVRDARQQLVLQAVELDQLRVLLLDPLARGIAYCLACRSAIRA